MRPLKGQPNHARQVLVSVNFQILVGRQQIHQDMGPVDIGSSFP